MEYNKQYFKQLNLKEEVKKLRKISGMTRGDSLKNLINYVRDKDGEEGIKRVDKVLKEIGYKLPDVSRIDEMEWISISIPTIYIIACVKIFNFTKKDIINMGEKAFFYSKQRKFFIRYFLSFKKTVKIASKNWRKHYSFGELELEKFDKNKNEAIIRLKDYKRHPVLCLFFQGIFSAMCKMTTGSKRVQTKEIKCMFKGDPYHEFKLKWD